MVDLTEELSRRGHRTTVLTLWDGPHRESRAELVRLPRRWPPPLRSAAVVAWIVGHRKDYDIVYATGLQAEAVAGSRLARRPVIVKIVGDPAWERGRRLGLTTAEFDEFQRARPQHPTLRALCALRNWSVRAPTKVMVPSDFLAQCVAGWRGDDDVRVISNGVRVSSGVAVRPKEGGLERVVVVSRLAEHKRIDVVVEAVARTPGLHLEVVGDGPERERLERLADSLGIRSRVTFCGSVSHDEVMRHLAEADALVSASCYEGLPHVVIEALTTATPVVTSAAGGVPEVLGGGTGGVIVDPPTVEEFTRVLNDLRADPDRVQLLRAGAAELGKQWEFSTTADRVESLLLECSPSAGGH